MSIIQSNPESTTTDSSFGASLNNGLSSLKNIFSQLQNEVQGFASSSDKDNQGAPVRSRSYFDLPLSSSPPHFRNLNSFTNLDYKPDIYSSVNNLQTNDHLFVDRPITFSSFANINDFQISNTEPLDHTPLPGTGHLPISNKKRYPEMITFENNFPPLSKLFDNFQEGNVVKSVPDANNVPPLLSYRVQNFDNVEDPLTFFKSWNFIPITLTIY